MTDQDQVAGFCNTGGVCITSAPGVDFTVDGLFHAALIPSANNAMNALARSTGMTTEQFAEKMNQKVLELGVSDMHFEEPTGMSANNQITAEDYTKIIAAAFSNSYLRNVSTIDTYDLQSTNNSAYNQIIQSTDELLGNPDFTILGGKTGYLNKFSGYNFGCLLRNPDGKEFIIVVLGETSLPAAFDDTKNLAKLTIQAGPVLS